MLNHNPCYFCVKMFYRTTVTQCISILITLVVNNANTLVVINVCINSKPTRIIFCKSIPNEISHSRYHSGSSGLR